MRKLRVRHDTQTGPGLGPTVQSNSLFPSLATNLLSASGPVIPTGPVCVLVHKGHTSPRGVQGSRQACEEKTQFPFFFLTTPCSGPSKPLCKKTFMSLLLILRKRTQRGGLSKVMQPVHTAGPSRGHHLGVPSHGTGGSHPGPTPFTLTSLGPDSPTCKTG